MIVYGKYVQCVNLFCESGTAVVLNSVGEHPEFLESKFILIFTHSFTLVFCQPRSSRAVRRCTTLTQRTRESWASARATSSPWPIRSTRTGTRECWTASRDFSLSTTSRSLFRCHTNRNRARELRRRLTERRRKRRWKGRVELVEREESEAKGLSADYSFSPSAPASRPPTSTFCHLEFWRRWSHFKVQSRISAC